MKTLLLLALLMPITLLAAGDKFLDYKFNENVVIRISNVPCKVPKMDAKKYPFSVVAFRIDKQILFGCYTHEGDDIVIQWAGGDKSIFPANYFLMEVEPNT